jgi:hypothetical protein
MPLAKDLFSKLRERMNAAERNALDSAVKYFYPQSATRSSNTAISVNVEEFMSMLDIAEEFNEILPTTYFTPSKIRGVRKSLLSGIVELFLAVQEQAENDTKSTRYLARFASRLHPGDTVITFNWDTLLEQQMVAQDVAFSRRPTTKKERVSLLKLHGSIDWYAGGELLSHKGFSRIHRQLYRASSETMTSRRDRLEGALPFIIPPSFYKSFRGNADVEELWAQSFRQLRDADEVFICGYSVPREDFFARFVIRRAIRLNRIKRRRSGKTTGLRKLVVIDPSTSVPAFVRQNVFPGAKHEKSKFETSSLAGKKKKKKRTSN